MEIGRLAETETPRVAGGFAQPESGSLHVAVDFAGGISDLRELARGVTLRL
ncbi:hypothetical protein [Poseidonocella sp. HB161398]|uniref:hypothetical protein n=1 Tax=Poseidonocella sp. HB161398 TaxID=2320855 RepID=UPI0014864C6B|nr:hypothetical protein [Poseidonocella sp. HB161398]